MRLLRLRLGSLPGIRRSFDVTDLDAGINVVVGPNASGKSSLLRAVRALLYDDEKVGADVLLEGSFIDAQGELQARRVGADLRWRRDGREVTPPKLPPHDLLGCYALGLEDLTTAGTTDEAIGAELATALRGGYDVKALTSQPPFRRKSNHGKSEHERLEAARERVAKVERAREELTRDQESIARWQAEVDAAQEARDDAEAHRGALALLGAKRERRRRQLALEAFPDGMDRLVGDEGRRLDALREAQAERARELDEAHRARHQAEVELQASGLAESAMTSADLDVWRARLRELRTAETAIASLEARAREARADLTAARASLRTAPSDADSKDAASLAGTDGPRLDPASLTAVDRALEAKRDVEAELRTIGRALDSLPSGPDPRLDREPLRTARQALLEVLAAPQPRRWWARGLAALASLAALGGSIALAAIGGAATLPLVGLGALGLAGLALTLRGGSSADRAAAVASFGSTGLDAPASWDRDAVRARMLQIDATLAEAERHASLLDERHQLERRLEAAEGRLAVVVADLGPVADRVGFDPRQLDAGVQRWLRLLDAAERAAHELRQAETELEALRPDHASTSQALDAFLSAHGIPDVGAAGGAEVLGARLDGLAARLAERDRAVRERDRAITDIERAEGERQRSIADIAALLDAAGLAPASATDAALAEADRALRQRLEQLDAFRPLRKAWSDADVLVRDRADSLASRPDLLAVVDADDEAALERALEVLVATEAAGQEAREHITRTRTLIDEAERQRALERASSERQVAEEALRDRVDEALLAEAGLFLLEAVESEYVQASQPAALRNASDWFRRFTRDQYELAFDGRDATFSANETSTGEHRRLSELSTGTRTQLLLAVRIAYATEAETERGAEPLPFFLDEALTTADAERFRAVGASLRLLADEGGRQVFYLTARPEDASLWASTTADGVHVIDIARLRSGQATVTDPAVLSVPERPEPPAPAGRSPEAYAAVLSVPPIDPWSPPSSCHVFHLLRDDLPLLHRLVRAGVERLGTLRTFLDGPAAPAVLDDGALARLQARAVGAVAYLEAWRVGRGRPVDRAALVEAEGVSETFLDRVDTLAARVGRDARALLQALEDGEVARYRSKDREQLTAWLEQHDYLDGRDVLDQAGLRQRAVAGLASASPEIRADPDALLEEGAALTSWLTAGIEAGQQRDPDPGEAPES